MNSGQERPVTSHRDAVISGAMSLSSRWQEFRKAALDHFAATPSGQGKEVERIPELVQDHLLACDEVVLPAAQGVTTGVFFFPKESANPPREVQAGKPKLVVMMAGLGQRGVEGLWLWILHALRQGFAVLVVLLDGHSRQAGTLFDPRLATRTLPLVLQRLARLAVTHDSFVVGHGFGATMTLLACCREDSRHGLKAAACLAPWLEWNGCLESQGGLPPLAKPVVLFRDSLQLTRFYGPTGLTRLWRGDQTRDLRKRLFVRTTLESQLATFFQENIRISEVFAQAQVPLLVVLPGHGVKAGQSVPDAADGASNLVEIVRDDVRNARGVQYSEQWTESVFSHFLKQGS